MSARCSLEALQQVDDELEALEMKDPEVYEDFKALFKRNRMVGYKNIAKLLMDERTPQELNDGG